MRHDSWGVCFDRLGVGVENLTARNSPDMLGKNTGTKEVPVGALNAPTIPFCTKIWGEAIRDDGNSPNSLFWVETASFRVDVFCSFFVDFRGAPNKYKTPIFKVL